MNFEIVKATSIDAEDIMRIKKTASIEGYTSPENGITLRDMEDKFSETVMQDGVKNWTEGIAKETEFGKRQTYVAVSAGKVVGFTSPYIEDGKRRIGALYVDPEFQGHGIGSALLKKAIGWHGKNTQIYLLVVKHNSNALQLYKRFGFKPTGTTFDEEYDEKEKIKHLAEIEMVLS